MRLVSVLLLSLLMMSASKCKENWQPNSIEQYYRVLKNTIDMEDSKKGLENLRSLLDSGLDPKTRNIWSQDRYTLLHEIAYRIEENEWHANHEKMVRLLVKRGADIHAVSELGMRKTVTMMACHLTPYLKLIVELGGDINQAQYSEGMVKYTPFSACASFFNYDGMRFLLERGVDMYEENRCRGYEIVAGEEDFWRLLVEEYGFDENRCILGA